jgi:hypothetical protein
VWILRWQNPLKQLPACADVRVFIHHQADGLAEINELGLMGVRFMPLHVCVYLLWESAGLRPPYNLFGPIASELHCARMCAAAYLDQM